MKRLQHQSYSGFCVLMYMNVNVPCNYWELKYEKQDISTICTDCITQNAPSLLQQEDHSNVHFTSIMQILPS